MKGAGERLLLASAVALVLVAIALTISPQPAEARDRDCSDFPNQAAAQNALQPGDPDGLDGDGDGVACETNPCPCSSAGGGGGGGGGGPAGGSGGGGSAGPSAQGARVIEVTDGDTVKVRLGGRERDVRVIGIDTPEVYFGEECGGAEASASMKRLLEPGDRVTLTPDSSQDAVDDFGRLLRYIERGGRDVGRVQVRRGWAKVYVYAGVPFQRVDGYRRKQDSARVGDRGVWRACGGDFHQPL